LEDRRLLSVTVVGIPNWVEQGPGSTNGGQDFTFSSNPVSGATNALAAHPTTAVWARWTGLKDLDGLELAEKFPHWAMACHGIRASATNHFTGDGWWAWCIPLKGGDVSFGVVFDQRRVQWPEGGWPGERLKNFLMQHPVAREILADAQWREGDVHWRKNLPYSSRTFAGDGFALVGDASAFLDPLYSPGMDWISFTGGSTGQTATPTRTNTPEVAPGTPTQTHTRTAHFQKRAHADRQRNVGSRNVP